MPDVQSYIYNMLDIYIYISIFYLFNTLIMSDTYLKFYQEIVKMATIHLQIRLKCILYSQATGQAESATTKEARELAAAGYQRLMAYRRSDGSFAAEHDDEAEGDVW